MEELTIIERIAELEHVAGKLEPDSNERHRITEAAFHYADQFIESLAEKPGFVKGNLSKPEALEIRETPGSIQQLLGILKDEVDVAGINSASGRHMGYIPGGGLFTSAIADFLAAAANRYAGIAYSSPGAVEIENQLIRWLTSLVGYGPGAHGNLTSGGSIANLVAIKTARDFHQVSAATVKKSVIYIGANAHHCIHKAIDITGLKEAVIRNIPLDGRFRMDTTALFLQLQADTDSGLQPFLIVASAGTTDTGAIDPLNQIAALSKQFNTWFHVDAAYGGFFMMVDELRHRFRGIQKAHSIVMDPHKTLFLPYGSGVVLVRNKNAMLDSFSHQAPYITDAYDMDDIDPSDTGPELTRHFRGLRMWLPIHLHGLTPFRANLSEKIMLSRLFRTEAQKMGFETGPEPDLSVVIFRLPGDDDNRENELFLKKLHHNGKVFFSSTRINGKLWIRCAVVSFRTHLGEILEALQMIRSIGDAVFFERSRQAIQFPCDDDCLIAV
ncbi:pyridoxal phosphate-dependent decarboxylase family protein [Flavitalea sp.]|nr:aminotransferase class V-fold PLP-dependent enzyme [Flavitalea sp.]